MRPWLPTSMCRLSSESLTQPMAVEGLSKEPYPSNGLTLDSWYSVERNIFTWGNSKDGVYRDPQNLHPKPNASSGQEIINLLGDTCSVQW